MVSSQLSGQTVALSQVSQSTTQYSVPVIQPVVQPYDRSSSFVEDMTWVSAVLFEIAFTVSLPESIMETCSVVLTFETVDEILWSDH